MEDAIEVACGSCGHAFTRSKFNPNMDLCPECRKAARAARGPAPAQGREFVCGKCNEPFTISKFQPYVEVETPATCPRCRRNARIRKYQRSKAAKGKEAPGQPAEASLPAQE